MQNIPNLITSFRLIAALALTYLCMAGPAHGVSTFLPILITAGISDLLDGFVARRFKWTSEFGAKLDSISDLMFYCAVALFLSINASSAFFSFAWIILAGAAVQLFHVWLSFARLGQYPAYHSNFSKLFAYCILFGLIAFWLTKAPQILAVLAFTWIASSLEGIAITLVLKQPWTNVSSIRAALAKNAA
jgi:cardiolipin synthase (CMP-forming)